MRRLNVRAFRPARPQGQLFTPDGIAFLKLYAEHIKRKARS
jgi:hypothetical protein